MYDHNPSGGTGGMPCPVPEGRGGPVRRFMRSVARSMAALFLIPLFASCGSTKAVTSSESRSVESLLNRVDSLMRVHSVVRQDSAWRESVMRQFQSIRERSDTSRTQVVDTSGNVLREKIIINNTREVTSETDRQEREVLMRRISEMDSVIRVMQQAVSRTDSAVRQRETVREKAGRMTFLQRLHMGAGDVAIFILLLAVAARFVFGKWWLPFGK